MDLDDGTVPSLGQIKPSQGLWQVPDKLAEDIVADPTTGAVDSRGKAQSRSRRQAPKVSAQAGSLWQTDAPSIALQSSNQPAHLLASTRQSSHNVPGCDLHALLSAPQSAPATPQDWQSLLAVPHPTSEASTVREVPEMLAEAAGSMVSPHAGPNAPAVKPQNSHAQVQPREESDGASTSVWSCSPTAAEARGATEHSTKRENSFALGDLALFHQDAASADNLFDSDASWDALAASVPDINFFLPGLTSAGSDAMLQPQAACPPSAAGMLTSHPLMSANQSGIYNASVVHVPDNMLCVQQSQAPAQTAWKQDRNAQSYNPHQACQQQRAAHAAPALGIPCMPYMTAPDSSQQGHTNTRSMTHPTAEQMAAHQAAASQYSAQLAHSAAYHGYFSGGAYPQMQPCPTMPVPSAVSLHKRASRLEICREKKRNRTSGGIKIRYHMRQLTAHMRPRLRGRFVRSSAAAAAAASAAAAGEVKLEEEGIPNADEAAGELDGEIYSDDEA